MDLLFQRLGREHRHERVRPQNLIDAKLYMILDDERIKLFHNPTAHFS